MQPLKDVKVLDLTRVLAGPYCTMILADLGADVVKVEHPAGGDDARGFGPFLPSGMSGYFASINRGKRSLALNLKDQADRETFLKLLHKADVLVENFRPGTMAELGFAASTLRNAHPRLIYASLSGFGHSTDDRRPAYDVVIQALSGLMSITGTDAAHPVRAGTSISDILTGMYGAIAILSALRHRDQTGHGAVIDLAMLDCTVAALENAVVRYSVTGEIPQPLGTRHPSITPFQAYQTADGPLIIAAGNDLLFCRLCQVLQCPGLAEDERFRTNALRTQHAEALAAELEPRLREQTVADWLARLAAAGIPAAPLRTIAEVVTDPALADRGVLHSMRDGEGQRFVTAGSPLRFDGTPLRPAETAPVLDADRSDIFRHWLGE